LSCTYISSIWQFVGPHIELICIFLLSVCSDGKVKDEFLEAMSLQSVAEVRYTLYVHVQTKGHKQDRLLLYLR